MFTDDQDIQRELSTALNVEPSNRFEAGVRQRINEARPHRLLRPIWLATAAAVVVLVTGVWLTSWRSRTVDPASQTVESTRPSVTPQDAAAASAPAEPGTPTGVIRWPPRAFRPGANPTHLPVQVEVEAPDVLVPAGQLALIKRLVRQASSGRVDLPEVEGPSTQPTELVVTPVVIEPIAVAGAQPAGGPSQGPKGLQ